ncbi:hypothetical protein FJZ28_01675 [Candidatus Peregrinibacteria bacterium]|nr:hypothetical protein [Candidatus Peregrinibacteria bacterium]
MDASSSFGKALLTLIGAVSGVLIAYAFFVKDDAEALKPKQDAACEGTPIAVDYPYYGGMLQPHACAPQCEDNKQHYILYSNGKATQCQILPGCLDWGEDQGVTCVPQK